VSALAAAFNWAGRVPGTYHAPMPDHGRSVAITADRPKKETT